MHLFNVAIRLSFSANPLISWILFLTFAGLSSPQAKDRSVAVLNGQKFTAADVERLLQGLPPQLRDKAKGNLQGFLHQYALFAHLTTLAEKEGLHEQSPWAEQLSWQQLQILAQAAINERARPGAARVDSSQANTDALKQWLDQLRTETQVSFEDPEYLRLPPEQLSGVAKERVVARVNGQPLTAGELQRLLTGAEPQVRQNFYQQREEFLRQLALMRRLAEIARTEQLHERSPYREQLLWARMNVLAQALLSWQSSRIEVSPEEARAYYRQRQADYEAARVRVIYLAFDPYGKGATTPDGKKIPAEPEVRNLAQQLYQDLTRGADFVKLVRQFSQDEVSVKKDGDFGTIRKFDPLPQAIKDAIFALQPGQVSPPVRQPNGYYLFRLEERHGIPYEEVQQEILRTLREKKFKDWFDSIRQAVEVVIEDPQYFHQAANR